MALLLGRGVEGVNLYVNVHILWAFLLQESQLAPSARASHSRIPYQHSCNTLFAEWKTTAHWSW